MQSDPNAIPTLSWLWQNLISEGIAAVVIGVLVAIAKKYRPEWLTPLLYGVIGMVLFGAVLYSSALYARWPLWTPIILVGSLIAASAVRLVVALVDRRSAPSFPSPVGQSGAEKALIESRSRVGELERKLSSVLEQYDDTEWLRQVSAKQASAIRDCVDVDCQIGGHRLVGDNPYIDFSIRVRSNCVYQLFLSDTISGSISFNDRLTHTPTMANNRVKGLGINETAYFEIHQPLTGAEAAQMLNEQGSFGFGGLITHLSGVPGLEERRFELPCAVTINPVFIDAYYPKLRIQIEPSTLQGYYGNSLSDKGTGMEVPSIPLGTILNLKVKFENRRPLKVRQFKLVTSRPVVAAEAGEIKQKPYRDVAGRKQSDGFELYPNLAEQKIDVDRNNRIEGWLQFIVPGVPPEGMLDPTRFVVRLHVVDESGEEHRQDVTGLSYGLRSTIDWTADQA